ncbi:MAG: response regulator, partial [Candidatus Latescibacterota bacterium]
DTGCGIGEDAMRHIFDPFFTTKGQGEGTGLGLAMVDGIVAQSGGCITVDSQVGHGTRFVIYLPLHTDMLADEVEDSTRLICGGDETILLVEDEEIVRGFAQYLLESWGYVVLVAEDGNKACEIFDEQEGKIDLLLTDVIMPDMGGQMLVERLKARQENLKIVFMSGYTHDFIGRHGALDMDMAFIQKPFTREDLAEKIRDVLDA